jgi:hypothetical protein
LGHALPNSYNRSFVDSEEDKAEWRRDPEKYRQYRKMVESELNQRYKTVLRNSAESQEANEVRSFQTA